MSKISITAVESKTLVADEITPQKILDCDEVATGEVLLVSFLELLVSIEVLIDCSD